MDFSSNMAISNIFGFIGQKNTTDVVIDADKIPKEKLRSWTNKYGYFGRAAFHGAKVVDGMNTEGLSIAVLTLPGSVYPSYDPKNTNPVLAIYDIPAYVLSQAHSVRHAIKLIKGHQLVQSAVEENNGIFIKDIPIHFVLRDKNGQSAVIEFLAGKVTIYENAGDILTNSPSYDWQQEHANHYASLSTSKSKSDQFSERVHKYKEITQNATSAEANLVGMLGDFTAASRFARGNIILNNLPMPKSTQEALYQASSLINILAVPKLDNSKSATIWSTIKDLDNVIFYSKNHGQFQGDGSILPESITGGYSMIDLNGINFKVIPQEYNHMTTQVTDPKNIKHLVSAKDLPDFSGG